MRIAGRYLVTIGLAFIIVALLCELLIPDYMWMAVLIIPGFISAFYGFRRMDEEELRHAEGTRKLD